MTHTAKKNRAEMAYNTQLGQYYLLQRKKSLELGLSKSLTIPYAINYLNQADSQSNVPTIIDFGCSDGTVLNHINKAFSDKVLQIVGMDFNPSVLKKAKRDHPKFNFHSLDIVDGGANNYRNMADVALLINTLHEIFSLYSYNGNFNPEKGYIAIDKAIKNITSTIKPGGIFILFDGVESYSDLSNKVTLELKNKKVETKLLLFQKEYKPYPINIKRVGKLQYEMSLKAFTRFITKYRFLGNIVWDLEREESYQYFNKFEFRQLFEKNNLQIEAINLISPNLGKWTDIVKILDPKITFPYEHILLIGKKKLN